MHIISTRARDTIKYCRNELQ